MSPLALCLALAVGAAPLVDLEPTRTDARPNNDSFPSRFTAVGGKVLFRASGRRGAEPWFTDGTDAGTALLLDVYPGEQSGDFQPIALLGQRLLFLANPPTGAALFSTDGTPAGTVQLATLLQGGETSITGLGVALAQRVIFAVNANNTQQVYSSDGTASGTRALGPLSALGPSAVLTGSSVAAGGVAMLLGLDPNNASRGALYATDGLQPPSVLATFTGRVSAPLALGSAALFLVQATAAGAPQWLWRTNGTGAGTAPVGGLSDGYGVGVVLGPSAYYGMFPGLGNCSGRLWRSDATTAGTVALSVPGVCNTGLVPVGGQLFFPGASSGGGAEPWVFDPNAATASPLLDIVPGIFGSNPNGIASDGALAFFTTFQGDLWSTDGTSARTQPVLSTVGYGVAAAVVDGRGFLGLRRSTTEAYDLWVSDGTAAGTRRPRVLNPGTDPSAPVFFGHAGDLALAATQQGRLFAIDVANGTAAPLLEVLDGGLRMVGPAASLGARALFRRASATGLTPWVSDGTVAGTVPLAPLAGALLSSQPSAPVALGGAAFFAADDGVHGDELWSSDGTAAGTSLVGDLRAGALGSSITELVAGPRAVFFVADDGVAGAELWRSDGTDGGTFRVADLAPGPTSSFPRGLQVLGDGVAFTAAPSLGAGQRLCVSDGSDKGTRCPLSSGPGATGSFPSVVAAAGPAALFTAVAPALGRGLYALLPDGGVERLAARAVLEAAQTSDTAFLALVADGGVELWASDGTATGTRTLGAFSTLGNLRAVGTQLYFSANGDAGSGTELWRSDGTAAGTLLAAELAPDALSSSPGPVEWVGNALLVAARGETFDVEPFRVALPPQVDNTGPAIAAVLEGPQRDGGWFVGDVAVRFEVTDPGSAVQAREGCDPQVVTADTRGLTLTCAATSAGGQSRLSVTLRRDATAPQLRCPDPGALTSPDGGAVAFAFSVSATDAIDPNPTVTVKAPASGKFQVGVTEVSATAQDEAGNSSSCAFEVRVASPGVTEEPAPRPSPAGCGCGASPSGLGALALLLLALRSLSARRQGASTRP